MQAGQADRPPGEVDLHMAQSTNDVIPTAIRLGAVTELPKLEAAFENLKG